MPPMVAKPNSAVFEILATRGTQGRSVHQSDGIAQIVVAVGAVDLRVEMDLEHFEALNVGEGQSVHGILKLRALKGL